MMSATEQVAAQDLADDMLCLLALSGCVDRAAFSSNWLGRKAWPHYHTPTPRAARALKRLREIGYSECLGTNGLWRLTEAGVAHVKASGVPDMLRPGLRPNTSSREGDAP